MSNKHWEKWAEQDPYFAVLSEEKFRQNSISGHEAEFFESGEAEIIHRIEMLHKLFGLGNRRTAIDFGCGVGRLVIPLTQFYKRVIGIDVAPAMLAEAAKNSAKRGITDVAFCHSASEVPALAKDVDLIQSNIVFQHIEVSIGLSIVASLLDCLAPNGLAALHFTTDRNLLVSKELVYKIKHNIPSAYILLNLMQGKKWNEPIMAMNKYSIYKIVDLFRHKGMSDIFLEPTFESAYGFIVYARKRP